MSEREYVRGHRGAHAGLATVGLALAAGLAFALPSSAEPALPQPTITGEAVVGATLVSSEVADSGLYRWQRCNPDISTCGADAPHGDPSWPDIPGAEQQSYVISESDLGHMIRVRAKGTSLGEKWRTSAPVGPVEEATVEEEVAASPPAPRHGASVLGEPVAGTVRVKLPGQAGFAPLKGLTEIPVGTVIDTRGSRVQLIAATGNFGNQTPDKAIQFYAGLFKIVQPASSDAPATAQLLGKLACPTRRGGKKPRAARAGGEGPVAEISARRKRRLWGSGRGGYRTRGSGSTGSVVGTTWLTMDTCSGTLTKVVEGIGVRVFDKRTKKSVLVGPGERYFASLG